MQRSLVMNGEAKPGQTVSREAREWDDVGSGLAQDLYEWDRVQEARRMVAGELAAAPTLEHVRILLAWLDGSTSAVPVLEEPEPPF